MGCDQTDWLSNKEYLQRFNRKAAEQRIPLSGSLAITHRCNLRCVHCYLGDQSVINSDPTQEITTAQWIALIDEITEAGCLNLLITGGEPLLRKDFSEIYRHAKTNGMLVSVFTNGTMFTDEIISLFEEFPPSAVEISLYGATAETYEKITGIAGSYERCVNGIHLLLDHQVSVKLKTILMTLNRHEYDSIKDMAAAYGVPFRFDAAIFPCISGDKTPLSMRLPPEDVIGIEFADEGRVQDWKDFIHRFQEVPESDALYQCGAGLTAFHIDPFGNLQPCLMTVNYKYSLLKDRFLKVWQENIPAIRKKKAGAGFICNQCEKKLLCSFCPAFFAMENGSEDILSEYLCEMGQLRFQAINNIHPKEVCNES